MRTLTLKYYFVIATAISLLSVTFKYCNSSRDGTYQKINVVSSEIKGCLSDILNEETNGVEFSSYSGQNKLFIE